MKIKLEIEQQEAYLLGLVLKVAALERQRNSEKMSELTGQSVGYDQVTATIEHWSKKLEELGEVK